MELKFKNGLERTRYERSVDELRMILWEETNSSEDILNAMTEAEYIYDKEKDIYIKEVNDTLPEKFDDGLSKVGDMLPKIKAGRHIYRTLKANKDNLPYNLLYLANKVDDVKKTLNNDVKDVYEIVCENANALVNEEAISSNDSSAELLASIKDTNSKLFNTLAEKNREYAIETHSLLAASDSSLSLCDREELEDDHRYYNKMANMLDAFITNEEAVSKCAAKKIKAEVADSSFVNAVEIDINYTDENKKLAVRKIFDEAEKCTINNEDLIEFIKGVNKHIFTKIPDDEFLDFFAVPTKKISKTLKEDK